MRLYLILDFCQLEEEKWIRSDSEISFLPDNLFPSEGSVHENSHTRDPEDGET